MVRGHMIDRGGWFYSESEEVYEIIVLFGYLSDCSRFFIGTS